MGYGLFSLTYLTSGLNVFVHGLCGPFKINMSNLIVISVALIIFGDMLGAPSNIAGAPSNSMKGQFCPSFKKIKSIFFPLSEAFSLFTESLPQKLLLFSLPRRTSSPRASPAALGPICIRGRWPSS